MVEQRRAVCDGTKGRHKPGVEAGLDVKALVLVRHQDRHLWPAQIRRPQPDRVVPVLLRALPEKLFPGKKLWVGEKGFGA